MYVAETSDRRCSNWRISSILSTTLFRSRAPVSILPRWRKTFTNSGGHERSRPMDRAERTTDSGLSLPHGRMRADLTPYFAKYCLSRPVGRSSESLDRRTASPEPILPATHGISGLTVTGGSGPASGAR